MYMSEKERKQLSIKVLIYELLIFFPICLSGFMIANKSLIGAIIFFLLGYYFFIKFSNLVNNLYKKNIIISTIFPKW